VLATNRIGRDSPAPRWVITVGRVGDAGCRDLSASRSPRACPPADSQDPTSESARGRRKLLTDKFHQGDMQMLITVNRSRPAPPARAARAAVGFSHRRSAEAIAENVAEVTSAWTAPPAAAKRPGQQRRQGRTGRRGLSAAGRVLRRKNGQDAGPMRWHREHPNLHDRHPSCGRAGVAVVGPRRFNSQLAERSAC